MKTAILAALAALFLVTQAKATTVEYCKDLVLIIGVGVEARSNGADMLEAAELMLEAMAETDPSRAGSIESEKAVYGFASDIYSMSDAAFEYGYRDKIKAVAMRDCLAILNILDGFE